MSVLPLPPPPPQVAKPPMVPEVPIVLSVKTEVPPAPSSVKLPLAVVGASPAIKLGASGVHEGVKGLPPLWFEVVTEMAGDVPETTKLSMPANPPPDAFQPSLMFRFN